MAPEAFVQRSHNSVVQRGTDSTAGRLGKELRHHRSLVPWLLPGCMLTSTEAEQQQWSKEIDKCLYREKTYVKRLVKFLLLGVDEHSKSILLKQMLIIHQHHPL
ncbi:guanine nucleotide-binding protein subunit alpha-13 [Crotalus adamanteus]|uniref:Guanine nucleotide-binding protein subunit alpha-13 n=1 Tax=Crotalus adamanteus TaxID=8729 RepID=A0AAW1BF67_CROAD